METSETVESLQKKSRRILKISIISFIIAAILIFILPTVVTQYNVIGLAYDPNEIGDVIGGIVGPAIAMLGVILTFMAFWVQYEANIEQRRQFLVQMNLQEKQIIAQNDQYLLEQVESRVFKLIEVYNSNVNQLVFKSRFSDTVYEGKNFFYIFYLQFTELLKEIKHFDSSRDINKDNKIESQYKISLMAKNGSVDTKDWINYELAYIIVFFGVGAMGRENIKQIMADKYKKDYLSKLLNYLSHKPAEINVDSATKENWDKLMPAFEDFEHPNKERFNRFYNGHQSRLGHYYRQLYLSINYINGQEKLSYIQKWEYAKNFRALLSNHEQLIFYFNSISILGRDWELNHIISDANPQDENKRLITKYDLIKNIPKGFRVKYQVDKFYPNVEFDEDQPSINSYWEMLDESVYE